MPSLFNLRNEHSASYIFSVSRIGKAEDIQCKLFEEYESTVLAEALGRRSFVYIKHIHLHFFWKWPIISLDKIPRLVSFKALWSCTETIILTFNHLEAIEVHYKENNPGMFSSKTLISFRLKKERHEDLGWHGGE